MEKEFVKSWKSSTQVRKQRKFRFNAPLHIKAKFLSVHLSKELRQKYKKRNVRLRKGDKIKVCRGQFSGKTGKVERVDIKDSKAFVTDVESVKRDGTKKLYPLEPSNLMIIELNLDDKKRVKAFERK